MVKIKKNKIFKKISNSNNYQIKTRNRDKKFCSMTREIKNLQEAQWIPNTTKNNNKVYNSSSGNVSQTKVKITRFSKNYKKAKNKKELKLKKNKNININQNDIKSNNLFNNDHTNNLTYSKNSKKNKNVHKSENVRKISNDIYKYNYQDIEYFELKEVLGFLYDDLNIDLDSPNNKIKDRDDFKLKMNDMFKKYFVIYYSKILKTPENLVIFLNYLSKYIKFDTKEVIKLLNSKCKDKVIEENITLDHYFKPTLFLVEK